MEVLMHGFCFFELFPIGCIGIIVTMYSFLKYISDAVELEDYLR